MSETAKKTIRCNAGAKINLFLDVISKRDDGYHNLVSVMQRLELCDSLEFKKVNKPGYFKLVCDRRRMPTDAKNLVHKAYTALKLRYPQVDGIFVNLMKTVPVSAGLGGGSSDCAAALVALRRMFGLDVSDDELSAIARTLGADVPFFINGATALAEGIGDILTPIENVSALHILLVRPRISVSTKSVFSSFTLSEHHPDVNEMLSALSKGDIDEISSCLYNALESVTAGLYPIIRDIKSEMIENGASGSLMSGSGPTVFGIFKTKEAAESCMTVIKGAHPEINEMFVTETAAV